MLKGRLIEDEYIAQRRANEVDDQAEQPFFAFYQFLHRAQRVIPEFLTML